ncbi:uncharacterized protein HKW66_Vig0215280 [Vigna angularis]|uniref:Uncharacterized protein n=1 Tax=Phaseolus angularis TaxID=3914 RepID=A0A8T0JFU5_PHAAN|nr:uncharacterized protein HKW66_Vig0215280 [Vigna angularis]
MISMKPYHLDDLVTQVAQLRKENQQILTTERDHRLESLNEIIELWLCVRRRGEDEVGIPTVPFL